MNSMHNTFLNKIIIICITMFTHSIFILITVISLLNRPLISLKRKSKQTFKWFCYASEDRN